METTLRYCDICGRIENQSCGELKQYRLPMVIEDLATGRREGGARNYIICDDCALEAGEAMVKLQESHTTYGHRANFIVARV